MIWFQWNLVHTIMLPCLLKINSQIKMAIKFILMSFCTHFESGCINVGETPSHSHEVISSGLVLLANEFSLGIEYQKVHLRVLLQSLFITNS